MKAHKNGTKRFDELSYREQALAINAEVANLLAAMRHHVRTSPTHGRTKSKCQRQVNRLLGHVTAIA